MGRRAPKHTTGLPHNEQNPYTGKTLFLMVYETESVIPIEIGMSSFRTSNSDKENNETKLRLNFDLLSEKRERDEVFQAAYKH